MAASKCTRLTGALSRQLLDSVDSVLFDCDGVIWRGDQAIPGAPEVINSLKKNGKRVFFVTNNSTKTRQMYADKLGKLGFDATADEVFGTAYCSAVYLKNVCKLDGKDVGIHPLGVGPDPISGVQKDWANVPLDKEVQAHFSYMKLNRALQYLSNPDCQFVGTNTDTRLPLEGGKAVPGKQAVETAAQRQAQVVGKPSNFMFECAASQCLMVGDRLDTDIMLGSNCGLKTLLTLTGVSTVAEAEANQKSECPQQQKM
ncbi:hypothetical protein M9458_025123, partial [Cirrhinus mrigala]